ncbi:AI-2E family transporter [Devriesea agamarum]|uniref:AI-2E family transporter n=1 Tax=Devriesea agamarum TaxID=472569 RepID=UPI00071DC9D9|nr:AI-2E family transporter [Devriesea agamarum]
MSQPTNGPGKPHLDRSIVPRGVLILVALASAWLVLQGMQELASLIIPVFLALNLMIAVYPVGRFLVRHGAPRPVGAILCALIVLGLLVGFVLTLAWALSQLISELPRYSSEFNGLAGQVLDHLRKLGIAQETVDDWFSKINLGSFVGIASNLLSSIGSIGGLLAATIATVVFFGMDAIGLDQRLEVLGRHRPHAVTALEEFTRSIRSYWVVTAAFGVIVAVIDGLVLWGLGVPLPIVWAILLFLCNFIPNIGFVFALVPPALMALLDQGTATAITVVVVYCAVAMLVQGVVQPRVTGHAVGVSATISFLSVLFWSWVLGPIGALLSVPMTLLVKEFFIDVDPAVRWLNTFVADTPKAADSPADSPNDSDASDNIAESADIDGLEDDDAAKGIHQDPPGGHRQRR